MEEEIDVIDMIKYLWRKKIWLILVGIVSVILALIYTGVLLTPEYAATSQFILTNNELETEAEVYSYSKLPDRYFAIADSKKVMDKVIENLKIDIEDVSGFKEENVEIVHSPAKFLITINVNTDDAKKSADIANEIVKVTLEEIKNIYNDEEIKILDYAIENWEPINVDWIKNIIMFVAVGEILICAYLIYRYISVEIMNNDNKVDSKNI